MVQQEMEFGVLFSLVLQLQNREDSWKWPTILLSLAIFSLTQTGMLLTLERCPGTDEAVLVMKAHDAS